MEPEEPPPCILIRVGRRRGESAAETTAAVGAEFGVGNNMATGGSFRVLHQRA